MKLYNIVILTITIFGIGLQNEAYSQTCRVKTSIGMNGNPVYTEVYEYDYVDEKPQFPGGDNSLVDYINSTRIYPHEAYEAGVEGRVTCAFIVQPDGKISNIQVLRGVEKSLNDEAVRIVANMPVWVPGKLNKQAVPVRVVRCIPFRK